MEIPTELQQAALDTVILNEPFLAPDGKWYVFISKHELGSGKAHEIGQNCEHGLRMNRTNIFL